MISMQLLLGDVREPPGSHSARRQSGAASCRAPHRLALDDYVVDDSREAMVELVDFVKVDLPAVPTHRLKPLVHRLRRSSARIVWRGRPPLLALVPSSRAWSCASASKRSCVRSSRIELDGAVERHETAWDMAVFGGYKRVPLRFESADATSGV